MELLGRRRLGWGEVAPPELVQDMARVWFFEAVNKVAPWVFAALKEHVFPPYQAFFRDAAGDVKPDEPGNETVVAEALGRFLSFCRTLPGPAPARAPFDWAKLIASETLCPTLPPLRAWLEGWGSAFHLSDPWCLDVGLCTLLQLQINELRGLPENERPSKFVHPSLRLPPLPQEVVARADDLHSPTTGPVRLLSQPPDGPYNPYEESRAEAKVRLLPILGRDAVDRYLDRVEAACKAAERVRHRKEAHFRWLALYQCGSISRTDLARAVHADLTTVSVPIADLIRLLELTPRPGDLGRPPDIEETEARHRN